MCDKIIKNLYLGGSFLPTENSNELKNLGITHIVNVATEIPTIDDNYFTSLFIGLDDNVKSIERLLNNMKTIHKFIDDAIKKDKKILIHCNCGVSRSATVVISYLMGQLDYSLKDAYLLVKSKRKIIQPNLDFIRILQYYECSILKKPQSLTIDQYMSFN
jgi:protein-tyrosine phosphatase